VDFYTRRMHRLLRAPVVSAAFATECTFRRYTQQSLRPVNISTANRDFIYNHRSHNSTQCALLQLPVRHTGAQMSCSIQQHRHWQARGKGENQDDAHGEHVGAHALPDATVCIKITQTSHALGCRSTLEIS